MNSDPFALRTIRLYRIFIFFFTLLLWLPIFYEYQKRVGLSDAEIFAIQGIYQVFFCLLEIPTGMVADIWGRRRCMMIGAGMLVIANLVAIFTSQYSGFLFHFLLVAISRSFISGAGSAYLYDFLKSRGLQGRYKDIEGSARAYSLVGRVVGWAFIGSIMQWHLTLPYWLTALNAAIALGVACMLPMIAEDQAVSSERGADAGRGLVKDLKAVMKILGSSPVLRFVMFQGVALFILGRVLVDLFQPLLNAKSFSLETFGWVMSGITVFEALGSARPGWIQKRLGAMNSIFFLTAILGALFAALPWVGQWGTLVILAVFSFATGLSFPIQKQLLNDQITDSRYRATVLSVESIVDRAFMAGSAFLMARYLGAGRLDAFLIHAGILTFITVTALILVARFRLQRIAKLA